MAGGGERPCLLVASVLWNCQPKPRNKGDQQGALGTRGWTSGGEAGKTRVGPLEGVMLVLGLDLQN